MTEQDASEDEPAADGEDVDGGVAGARGDGAAGTDDGAATGGVDETATEGDDEAAARSDAEAAVEGDDEPAGESDDEAATEGDDEADLVERVRESEPGEIASEIDALRDRVEDLEADLADSEAEREELESKLKRKQADFQNFKRRQEQKREEATRRATEDLVERLLDVRDNLGRALDQDEDVDIRDGVETTRRQFDRVLEAENVEPIDPEPGTEVDPQRHEVLMRVESDREPGTVDQVHRTGYEMAGKVLRPAQVTVAEE